MNLKLSNDIINDVRFRAQQKRIACGFTQAELAERSGVSLGSVKRFERTGEISFSSLMAIAEIVGALDDFATLFAPTQTYATITEVLAKDVKRQRVRHAR